MRVVTLVVLFLFAATIGVDATAQPFKGKGSMKGVKNSPDTLGKDFLDPVQDAVKKLNKLNKKLKGRNLTTQDVDEINLELKEVIVELKGYLVDAQKALDEQEARGCCPCFKGRPDKRGDDCGEDGEACFVGPHGPGGHPGKHHKAPPPPEPVAETDAAKIEKAVKGQSFSDDKLRVLEQAMTENWATVGQVKRFLSLFTHSSDKLAALKLLSDKIVDRKNLFEIYDAFTHSSDKEEAKRILDGQ